MDRRQRRRRIGWRADIHQRWLFSAAPEQRKASIKNPGHGSNPVHASPDNREDYTHQGQNECLLAQVPGLRNSIELKEKQARPCKEEEQTEDFRTHRRIKFDPIGGGLNQPMRTEAGPSTRSRNPFGLQRQRIVEYGRIKVITVVTATRPRSNRLVEHLCSHRPSQSCT